MAKKENNKTTTENKQKTVKKGNGLTKVRAKEYRQRAREIIKPIKGDFAVTYFVYAVIIAVLGGIVGGLSLIGASPTKMGVGSTIASMLSTLFVLLTGGAFTISFINLAKQARKNSEKPKVGGLFYGFKERYTQSLGVHIMSAIFTLLWSLLLIVPGIIKSYAYSMSQYIALDNPNKSTLDCISESRKLMDGHKWELFCLQISHIGWFILVVLTLGILSFWVMPKYQQATYEFYLHISHKD